MHSVPWMSGLVSGLQNRVRRFESARNLRKPSELLFGWLFYGIVSIPYRTLSKKNGMDFSWGDMLQNKT